MKLSKEELSAKINDLAIDDEIKISLLEDIADSIDGNVIEELKIKYEALKERYKERFLKAEDVEEKKEDETEEEELKEEEVIDVKEI